MKDLSNEHIEDIGDKTWLTNLPNIVRSDNAPIFAAIVILKSLNNKKLLIYYYIILYFFR